MTLREILAEISRLVGRRPPRIRVPHAALLPVAVISEGVARLRGKSTRVTLESVRMARKHMYFSSEKAVQELGYHWRSPAAAFEDALRWFREQGLLGSLRAPSYGCLSRWSGFRPLRARSLNVRQIDDRSSERVAWSTASRAKGPRNHRDKWMPAANPCATMWRIGYVLAVRTTGERYCARCATRSRASSSAPSMNVDFRRRNTGNPIAYRPGASTTTPPS